jgi:hypothetical protein
LDARAFERCRRRDHDRERGSFPEPPRGRLMVAVPGLIRGQDPREPNGLEPPPVPANSRNGRAHEIETTGKAA